MSISMFTVFFASVSVYFLFVPLSLVGLGLDGWGWSLLVGVSVSDKQEVVCRGSASEHSLPLQTRQTFARRALLLKHLHQHGVEQWSARRRRTSPHNLMCRCMFGNSNMKQMLDFPKDKVNCYRDSLAKHIKINEKFW